jgi:decaprenylphospho-beta-D-erythro-pentofuranosid-2-ulose 2-reductase
VSASPVLVIGAHSDIGRAIARAYAKAGRPLMLAARNPDRLEDDGNDLRIRHNVEVQLIALDVLDTSSHGQFLDRLVPFPDTVISVVGLLGDQNVAQAHAEIADLVMRTNYVDLALLLGEVANRMEARGNGAIIGVSSVAGDRGRASNYVYGSAKAGFTAFLSGLRNRLAKRGVKVVTVKPGFVDTRMTAGMKLPPLLTAKPAEVAQAVLRAEAKGRDVVYVKPVWRLLMLVIRAIPERLFKRLSL